MKNCFIFLLVFLLPIHVFAKKNSTQKPNYLAIKTTSAPIIDGLFSSGEWEKANIANGLIQYEPNSGQAATQKSEIRILYDDKNIYVCAQMYDSEPDKIAGQLFRRDGEGYSDWFEISIDSYGDQRTAFVFGINPRGVKRDILFYNDDDEDPGWDAVWHGAAQINGTGWTAEFSIPFSQLRYDSNQQEQNWGLQFWRYIARNDEQVFWSPRLQESSGFVSLFGSLKGIRTTLKPKRLEIMPYASSKLHRSPGNPANPFYNKNDFAGNVGADFKYGIGANFTLTGTVNPDFGQVEADPAVINLSAFETFFSERRPFFLEGTDIFEFGQTRTFNSNAPFIFYTRRIGRSPQGSVSNEDAEFTDSPEQTTIATAVKLSGKTANGWSIGVLDAVTTNEEAQFNIGSNTDKKEIIEPLSNFLVLRAKKDFDSGKTTVGGFFDAANRDLSTPNLKSLLRKNAYVGGFDFEHKLPNEDWIVSGLVTGSYLNGEAEVITRAQKGSQRYFHRPDADYMELDENATSLSGHNIELSITKNSGKHWIGSFTYGDVSPGFEVNDLGFQNRADYRSITTFLMYREKSPTKYFRNYSFYWWTNPGWNQGGDLIWAFNGAEVEFRFNNFWEIEINGRFAPETYNDRLTRGGPITRRPSDWGADFELKTDERKNISFAFAGGYREDTSGEWDKFLGLESTIRPNPSLSIELEAAYEWEFDNDQFVDRIEDELAQATFGSRYVFAGLNAKNQEISVRLAWTFTPDLTLQLFAAPYISSYDYSSFREFRTPGTYDFDIYGKDTGTVELNEDGSTTIDPDGAGPAADFELDNLDFNFRSIRINSVLRWEYKPGSVLFLVWQQERDDFEQKLGTLDFGNDYDALFSRHPVNTFLVKASYWFGY
ncbi:MAG: hypothetical protein DWQ05_22260 [Calditrichaeota bacterium]|nr:MAG: hypothetical protein DWQ05_22260 [Calditrichota bacterium]